MIPPNFNIVFFFLGGGGWEGGNILITREDKPLYLLLVITSAFENFIMRLRQGNVLTFLSKIISIKALSVYHRILC